MIYGLLSFFQNVGYIRHCLQFNTLPYALGNSIFQSVLHSNLPSILSIIFPVQKTLQFPPAFSYLYPGTFLGDQYQQIYQDHNLICVRKALWNETNLLVSNRDAFLKNSSNVSRELVFKKRVISV